MMHGLSFKRFLSVFTAHCRMRKHTCVFEKGFVEWLHVLFQL